MIKSKAIEYATAVNTAVETVNVAYGIILKNLWCGPQQKLIQDAERDCACGCVPISDMECPYGDDGRVIIRLKLNGSNKYSQRVKVEYRYEEWFQFTEYNVRWALECEKCGFRTPYCKTLEEAIEQFLNIQEVLKQKENKNEET